MRLLQLTEDNRELLRNGVLSLTQAYHMATLCAHGQRKFLELVKQGLVSTNAASEQAADTIKQRLSQSEMDVVTAMPKRSSIKGIESRVDAIGASLHPLFKDGP